MRRMIRFDCKGVALAATLDEGPNSTGLLIVSGGNEIRSGAHSGQAAMAAHFAALGHPVFRYDRRGIGESEGENHGFQSSADDVATAVTAFREAAPNMERLVAFGNCDAATALGLFHHGLAINALLLANPWVIETSGDSENTPPTGAAIRARYWNRLKNPRSLIDLFSGKINLCKLAGGLAKAAQKETPSSLAQRLAAALANSDRPTQLFIAQRDTTAMAFMAAWSSDSFAALRNRQNISMQQFPTASHSFADAAAKSWLLNEIANTLRGA